MNHTQSLEGVGSTGTSQARTWGVISLPSFQPWGLQSPTLNPEVKEQRTWGYLTGEHTTFTAQALETGSPESPH